jgi:hypothetical protein
MSLESDPEKRPLIRWWLAIFGASLLLYVSTADCGPEWQDSGWQQLRILRRQVEHPLGLALIHPLHHYLGRAAVFCLRFLEPAFAITLVSALAGAIAVANVACTVLIVTRRYSAALVACTALAFSHTFWQHSTHTESYALTAALLSGEWLCLALFSMTGRANLLFAVMLLNGLGLSNHLLASIATPIDLLVLVVAWRSRRLGKSQVIISLLALLAGAMPYLCLITMEMIHSHSVGGVIHSALFGSFGPAVLNTSISMTMLTNSAGYVLYNFPSLTIPLAALAVMRRRSLQSANHYWAWPGMIMNILLAELILYALFLARYAITDQYTFFIPLHAIIALLAGLGAATLTGQHREKWIGLALILNVISPLTYMATARELEGRAAFPAIEGKPYRNGYRSMFVPWGRGDEHAQRLNEAALNLAGQDGIILVVDPMIGFSLDYSQILGRIPLGVSLRSIATLTPERAAPIRTAMSDALSNHKPVVLVPAQKDRPDTYFEDANWQRRGDLYVLEGFRKP